MSNSDSQINAIDALLPQTQCELCEYPGCRPYAKAIIEENAPLNRCLPGGVPTLRAIGKYLEKDTEHLEDDLKKITKAPSIVIIDESLCIGCTKCLPVCPTDAIIGRSKRMHTVIADACTGCELCIPACPMDCIDIHPIQAKTGEDAKTQQNIWRTRFDNHQTRDKRRSKDHRSKHQSMKKSGPKKTSLKARQDAIQAALARMQEKKKEL